MAYATAAALMARFGEAALVQLSDRADPPAGAMDAAVVDTALADATETVNGYLASRYQVPLSPLPEPVKRAVCDIAWYLLHRDVVPDLVRTRYQDALAYLEKAARGIVVLQAAGVPAPEVPAGPAVLVAAPEPVFGYDALREF
jgi:phage gp36-like protein